MSRIKITLAGVSLLMSLSSHAQNITFADSNVKALCVANWDSNGDGELSYWEAAAVSTLGNVFRGNKTITAFEELENFTGLTAINDHAFYQSSIEHVAFPSTVMSIGEYAFCQSGISGELRIPGTVRDIDNYAFNGCVGLTAVILEEGVETVGWHAFSGHISVLSLPSTISYMSSMAVDPYDSSLPEGDYLYVYAHGTTPAAINEFAFYYVFGEAHLVVPFGSMEAYKAEPGWSHFGEYLQYGDVNSDGNVNNRDVISLRSYILGNNPTPFNVNVADVNGDGTINNRDVILLRNSIMNQ